MSTVTAIPQVEYYYDFHTDEEDLLGQADLHYNLIHNLVEVLRWLFRNPEWFIAVDLNLYASDNPKEKPVVPDIAVFKGVIRAERPEKQIRSWRVLPPINPPPAVVFEIASETTFVQDRSIKPGVYAGLGVSEYFCYDPRPDEEAQQPRLKGWRTVAGGPQEIAADEEGRLWSDELNSWVSPAGERLELLEPDGTRRLTAAEASGELARWEREHAEREREHAARETERVERLAARLRELGVNPDDLM